MTRSKSYRCSQVNTNTHANAHTRRDDDSWPPPHPHPRFERLMCEASTRTVHARFRPPLPSSGPLMIVITARQIQRTPSGIAGKVAAHRGPPFPHKAASGRIVTRRERGGRGGRGGADRGARGVFARGPNSSQHLCVGGP